MHGYNKDQDNLYDLWFTFKCVFHETILVIINTYNYLDDNDDDNGNNNNGTDNDDNDFDTDDFFFTCISKSILYC